MPVGHMGRGTEWVLFNFQTAYNPHHTHTEKGMLITSIAVWNIYFVTHQNEMCVH